MKISKKEIDAIIQEEYSKIKKVMALKKKKETLKEEIERLKEAYNLDEVRASGHKDKGDAYYMKGLPVQDFEEKRNGKEGHSVALKEEEEDEMLDIELGAETEERECGEIEEMLANLGRKLDDLLKGQEELSDEHADLAADHVELGAEGDIEIEDSDEDEEDIEISIDEEESVEECGDKMEEDAGEADETIEEQDGEAIVNAANQDTVNPNMKKVDNSNPMADELYENKVPGKSKNRLNPENNPLINEELERMKKLARL